MALPIAFHAGAAPVAHSVVVEGNAVALGELIDTSRIPPALRTQAAALTVASFGAARDAMVLSSRRVVERARALMPVLAFYLPEPPDEPIAVRRQPLTKATSASGPTIAAEPCMTATRVIVSGSIPAAADLAPSACDRPVGDTPFRYDATLGAVRVLRDIQPGETVAAVAPFALARIRPGEPLYVSAHVGPVVVNRRVRAIQPDSRGRSLFVEGAEGDIFAVPAPERTQ